MQLSQILTLALACAACSARADAEHIAIIKNMEGRIEVVRAGQTKVPRLATGCSSRTSSSPARMPPLASC